MKSFENAAAVLLAVILVCSAASCRPDTAAQVGGENEDSARYGIESEGLGMQDAAVFSGPQNGETQSVCDGVPLFGPSGASSNSKRGSAGSSQTSSGGEKHSGSETPSSNLAISSDNRQTDTPSGFYNDEWPVPQKPEIPIPDRLQAEIREAYARHTGREGVTADDVVIQSYYGTYGGSVAMMIGTKGSMYLTVITCETVAGFRFEYGSSQTISVYKDRKFYSLAGAYERGILSQDDVERIYYRGKYQPKDPLRTEICEAYVKHFGRDDITAGDVVIQNYFGEYNGSIPMMITDKYMGYGAMITCEMAGGYPFIYSSTQQMSVYREGGFYSLADACQKGFLTIDNLKEIYYMYYYSHYYLYQR